MAATIKTTRTLNIQLLDSTGSVMKLIKLDNPRTNVTKAEIEQACRLMFTGGTTSNGYTFDTPLFTKSTNGEINGSEAVALGTMKIVEIKTTTTDL